MLDRCVYMRWVGALAASTACLALPACAAEPEPAPRGGGGAPVSGVEGAETTQVDTAGGRDDSVTSCFAACQNTAFACRSAGAGTTSAALVPNAKGCAGTMAVGGAQQRVEVDCTERRVCVGDAPCGAGMFSAFSFAYGEGDAAGVCTRVR